MSRIEKIEGQISKVAPSLFESIRQILEPSYVDLTNFLKREDEHCRSTYVVRDTDDSLVAFCMVNYESLADTKAIYVGLGGISERYKNSGMASIAYLTFVKEAYREQKLLGEKFVLYAITATPTVYNSFSKLMVNLNPMQDGSYSDEASRIADLYGEKYSLVSKGHPFVFKGVAPDTLYSSSEASRIESITNKYNFTLFSDLDVVEREGDRLLLTFELPPKEVFDHFMKTYRQASVYRTNLYV